MTTKIKMIGENNHEITYFMDALVNDTCFVKGLSYMAKMNGGKSFSIIKFDANTHNLYKHNTKKNDYVIQSKYSNINMNETYGDYDLVHNNDPYKPKCKGTVTSNYCSSLTADGEETCNNSLGILGNDPSIQFTNCIWARGRCNDTSACCLTKPLKPDSPCYSPGDNTCLCMKETHGDYDLVHDNDTPYRIHDSSAKADLGWRISAPLTQVMR